ncbi:MbtH family protein [Streptomyces sp. Ru73]|uniref:MbtH family protein n=1 Tax=Streptomyces sp. Ru73 TaxID=2080748 RepID=UPI000CDDB499|nr:MbtH family protein [Streptomyces sp. Ru73]POX37952.1 MbtH family protein [Streptomyces sp. Ru73]
MAARTARSTRPSPEDTVPTTYQVLVNHEEQYALYPAVRELPDGWTPAGFTGTEDECAAHVDAHWTDTRPLSLRAAPHRPAAPAGRPGGGA